MKQPLIRLTCPSMYERGREWCCSKNRNTFAPAGYGSTPAAAFEAWDREVQRNRKETRERLKAMHLAKPFRPRVYLPWSGALIK